MGQIAPNLRAEHVEGVSVIDEQPGVVMLVQVASKPPREAFRKLVRRPGGISLASQRPFDRQIARFALPVRLFSAVR